MAAAAAPKKPKFVVPNLAHVPESSNAVQAGRRGPAAATGAATTTTTTTTDVSRFALFDLLNGLQSGNSAKALFQDWKRESAATANTTLQSGNTVYGDEEDRPLRFQPSEEDMLLHNGTSCDDIVSPYQQQKQPAPRPVVFNGRRVFRYLNAFKDGKGRSYANPAQQKWVDSQIAENADEYSRTLYPNRVVVGHEIRRRNWQPGMLNARGKPVLPTTFEFWLYPNFTSFTHDIIHSPAEWNYYMLAEDGQAVFAFFDLEIPWDCNLPAVHGTNRLELFAYTMSVVQAVLEQVLGVPHLAAWSDSKMLYDATVTNKKWSSHVHVAWPSRSIGSLRSAMLVVKEQLYDMDRRGLEFVKPLFYDAPIKASKHGPQQAVTAADAATVVAVLEESKERKCVVDLGVYTVGRQFRTPHSKKIDKPNKLQFVPGWNRPRAEGGPLYDDERYHLSAGGLLCRQSRALWNEQCVRDRGVLDSGLLYNEDAGTLDRLEAFALGGDETDEFFRTLPLSGAVNELRLWLVKLFERDPPSWIAQELEAPDAQDQIIHSNAGRVLRVLFDMDWRELYDSVADPKVRRRVQQTFLLGPQAAGTFLLLLCEWLQPGKPPQRQYQVKGKSGAEALLRDVALVAARVEEQHRCKGDAVGMFHALYNSIYAASKHHSKCRTEEQDKARDALARFVRDDFTKQLLEPMLQDSEYNSTVLCNALFFQRLCHRLFLCGGLYRYELRHPPTEKDLDVSGKSSGASGKRTAGYLSMDPSQQQLHVRVKAYRYALESSMDHRQHAAASLKTVLPQQRHVVSPPEHLMELFPEARCFGFA